MSADASAPFKVPMLRGLNFEPGSLEGMVAFRPLTRKFLTLKTGIRVYAGACMDCGHLELSVDTTELAKLLPHEKPDPRRGFPITPLPSPRIAKTSTTPLEPPDNADT